MAWSRGRVTSLAIWFALFALTAVFSGQSPDAGAEEYPFSAQRHYHPDLGNYSSLQLKSPVVGELTLGYRDTEFSSFPDYSMNNKYEYQRGPMDNSPEPLELIGLMIKEFDLFRGLKKIADDAEDRMDHYVERMKLKGEIRFYRNESNRWTVRENIGIDGKMIVPENDSDGKSGFPRGFMPNRLNWRINSNFSGKYLIGEVDIGPCLSMEGSLGRDGGLLMSFQFQF